jgi:hypothetical protein
LLNGAGEDLEASVAALREAFYAFEQGRYRRLSEYAAGRQPA